MQSEGWPDDALGRDLGAVVPPRGQASAHVAASVAPVRPADEKVSIPTFLGAVAIAWAACTASWIWVLVLPGYWWIALLLVVSAGPYGAARAALAFTRVPGRSTHWATTWGVLFSVAGGAALAVGVALGSSLGSAGPPGVSAAIACLLMGALIPIFWIPALPSAVVAFRIAGVLGSKRSSTASTAGASSEEQTTGTGRAARISGPNLGAALGGGLGSAAMVGVLTVVLNAAMAPADQLASEESNGLVGLGVAIAVATGAIAAVARRLGVGLLALGVGSGVVGFYSGAVVGVCLGFADG